MPTKEIRSVSDAILWANEVYKAWEIEPNQQSPIHVWYRGCHREKHKLIPGAFRDVENKKTIYEEGGMTGHLMRRLPEHRDDCPSTFDWLCLLRHYSLPVRLLDWSENLLVSLWMSVQEDDEKCKFDSETQKCRKSEPAILFALNARKLAEEVEFDYFKRKEPPVYGPSDFHVVIRSEMAQSSYLDELLQKPSVREAALSIGFSKLFWNYLIEVVCCLREEDICFVEKIKLNDIDDINIDDYDGLVFFASETTSEQLRLYDNFCQNMPMWKKKIGKSSSEIVRNWIFKFLVSLRKPVAVFPDRRNIRLIAQSGMFVLSGGDYLPKKLKREHATCRTPEPFHLEDWRKKKDFIHYAIIPSFCKDESGKDINIKQGIREELERIGIHGASIYPDLEKQGEYIKQLWKVDLYKD